MKLKNMERVHINVFVSILEHSLGWHHLHHVKKPKQFADLPHKLELKGSEVIENSDISLED